MQQRRADAEPRYSTIAGVDPYIDWAWGAGSGYFVLSDQGQEWLPVLLQLKRFSVATFANGTDCVEQRNLRDFRKSIQIAAVYTDPPAGLEESSHCTALVTREFFDLLARDEVLSACVSRVALASALHPEGRAKFNSMSTRKRK